MTNYRLRIGPKAIFPLWREGQTPLTWAAIGSSVAEDVDPENNPAINPNYPSIAPWRNTSGGGDIFRAWNSWCTGVWSESTGKFRIPSQGGHDDYAGNEVYLQQLTDDVPLWELEREPTGAIGNTGTLNDGQEDSMVYFDGRPRSTHGYDLFCDRNGDVWGSGNGPFQNGNNLATKFFKFSDSTSDWSVMATNTFIVNGASAAGAGSIVWDETRDEFYGYPSANAQLSKYVVATGTASLLSVYTDAGQQTRGIRIPELDSIVWLNPSYTKHIGVYDYGRTGGASLVQPGATGTAPTYGGYSGGVSIYPNGVWVPGYGGGVGAILCWHGGTSFYVLTPNASGDPSDSWAWSTLAADGSNALDPGNPNSTGVYGRLFYSTRLGGIGLSLQPDEPTYFFALE